MKFFPPIINFSTHLGSVECKRLITAKNSTLVIETGPEEVEIMTKMTKISKKSKNLHNYFDISFQFFFTGSHSDQLWK